MPNEDSSPQVLIDFIDPVQPVIRPTRRRMRFGQWINRVIYIAWTASSLVVLNGHEALPYLFFAVTAAVAFNEFQARRWFFCPACDVFLASSKKQHAAASAFCGHCSRLLFPERILQNHPGPVDLNTIIDHPEPTAKLAGVMLMLAILDETSGIVFEPMLEEDKLRYDRATGTHYAPVDVQLSIVATVKRFAGMDCWACDRPQSGNISLVLKEWSIECVAEAQPHELGETIVIRFPDYVPPPAPDFDTFNVLSEYPATIR